MGSLAVQDLVGAGFSVDTAGGEGVHAHDSVITTFAHSHCQHVFPRGDRVLGAEVTSYIGGRFFGIDGLFTDGTSVNVWFLRIDTIRGIWPSPPGTREPQEALGFLLYVGQDVRKKGEVEGDGILGGRQGIRVRGGVGLRNGGGWIPGYLRRGWFYRRGRATQEVVGSQSARGLRTKGRRLGDGRISGRHGSRSRRNRIRSISRGSGARNKVKTRGLLAVRGRWEEWLWEVARILDKGGEDTIRDSRVDS